MTVNKKPIPWPKSLTGSNRHLVLLLLLMCMSGGLKSQTLLDVGFGTSTQDDFNYQLALRRQFSPRLQGGIEVQQGLPRYRFVETKEISEGYALSVSLPGAYLLQDREKIKLYGIGRVGARFQGIIDPDDNDMRDSILNSTALLYEFGLLTSFAVTDNINLQGGMTFPSAYELSPLALAEYTWTKLHLGGSLALNNTLLFAHSNIGAAFGASGDTYKYIWSVEVGARFSFGEAKNELFQLIQPAF